MHENRREEMNLPQLSAHNYRSHLSSLGEGATKQTIFIHNWGGKGEMPPSQSKSKDNGKMTLGGDSALVLTQ